MIWAKKIVLLVLTVSYVLSELVRHHLGSSLALVALGAKPVYRLSAPQESTEEWKELPQKFKAVSIAHQATTVLLEQLIISRTHALVVLTA